MLKFCNIGLQYGFWSKKGFVAVPKMLGDFMHMPSTNLCDLMSTCNIGQRYYETSKGHWKLTHNFHPHVYVYHLTVYEADLKYDVVLLLVSRCHYQEEYVSLHTYVFVNMSHSHGCSRAV